MIRFALEYKGENVFKDGRSFKHKFHAQRKRETLSMGFLGDILIVEIEVKTEIEQLKERLQEAEECLKYSSLDLPNQARIMSCDYFNKHKVSNGN